MVPDDPDAPKVAPARTTCVSSASPGGGLCVEEFDGDRQCHNNWTVALSCR